MAIGFVVIVAIFAALGLLTLRQVTTAGSAASETMGRFEAVQHLQGFTVALADQTQAHYETVFEGREERIGSFLEARERRQQALAEVRNRIETGEQQQWLDDIDKAAAGFDDNFLSVMLPAWRAGDRNAVSRSEAVSDSLLQTIDDLNLQLASDLYARNQEAHRDASFAVTEARTYLVLASLIGVGLSLVIALVATRRLSRPLEELKEASRAWAEGDLDRRVETTGGDEIAELGQFFNNMAASIQHKMEQLTRLSDIALAVSSELDWDQTVDIVMQKGIETTDSQAAAIVLYDEEEGKFTDVYTKGLSDYFVTHMQFRPGGLADEAMTSGEPAIFSDNVKARHHLSKLCHDEGITAFICLPLKVRQKKLGVFYVYSAEVAAYGHEELSVLAILANQAAIAIQNAWMFKQSQKEAVSDGLTGLYNQRYFYSRLNEEIERSERNNKPLSVIFADLDRFKNFNDLNGHALGDKVLKEVARVIVESKRAIDVAARYGGEEFTLVLPETDSSGAQIIAHRIRRRVAGLLFEAKVRSTSHMTISIGVSSYPGDAMNAQELVDKADWAMYYGKRLGGDRVTVFHEESADFDRVKPEDLIQEELHLGAIHAMAESMEKRGSYDQRHAESVARLASGIASRMALDEDSVHRIRIAGLLHDIGLVSVPEDIINKRGSLNAAEWNRIKEHPEVGEAILMHVGSFKDFLPLVRHHHEHFDGAGYPDGLEKEDIPVGARIIAAADAYQAMVSERPHRGALTSEQALDEIRAAAGTQFDPGVVEALMALLAPQDTRTKR